MAPISSNASARGGSSVTSIMRANRSYGSSRSSNDPPQPPPPDRRPCFEALSPLYSPLMWINIHTACAGYSAMMLLMEVGNEEEVDTDADNDLSRMTQRNFLVYCALTTIFWTWLAIANFVYNEHRSLFGNWTEVILMLVFWGSSGFHFVVWYYQLYEGTLLDGFDATAGILIANLIFFFVQLLDSIHVFRYGGWKGDYQVALKENNIILKDSLLKNESHSLLHQHPSIVVPMGRSIGAATGRSVLPVLQEDVQSKELYLSYQRTGRVIDANFYDVCAVCGKHDNYCRCGSLKYINQCGKISSPAGSPLTWLFLNTSCMGISAALLWILYETDEDSRLIAIAQQYYLVYDFGTTLVWCFQALFNLSFAEDRSLFTTRLEMIVAIIFLADSGHTVYLWKFKNENVDIMAAMVVLNLIAYLAECVDGINVFRFGAWRRGEPSVPASTKYSNDSDDVKSINWNAGASIASSRAQTKAAANAAAARTKAVQEARAQKNKKTDRSSKRKGKKTSGKSSKTSDKNSNKR